MPLKELGDFSMDVRQTTDSAAGALYRFEPIPAWIKQGNDASTLIANAHSTLPLEASPDEDPLHYVYLSYQDRITDNSIERFSQRVFRVNDESQIPDSSQFLYHVSPDTGQVHFHHCNIIRGTEVIDCLNTDRIRALQRDTGLEQQIISDVFTIELIIDDLRVNDIIDIAATDIEHSGTHPLNGKFHLSRAWLAWGVGIDVYECRTVNDSKKPITIQHLDTASDINENTLVAPGDIDERRYQNLVPERNSNNVPYWFWPPCLIASTEQSWQEISRYLHDYYAREGIIGSPSVDDMPEELAEIDWQFPTADSLINVIRFVQDKVRYRAESNGIYTHTPKYPAETLKRRTGDCKDKSALFVSLLEKFGIDANLVLVNSGLKESVRDLNPSPFWFDHMIVGFDFDGKTYFVDLTMQKQGGNLDSLAPLGFGLALPLTADGSSLAPIADIKAALKYEDLRIIDLQYDTLEACTIDITRTYYHERANAMRFHIASSNNKSLREEFRESAASSYELSLEIVEPFQIQTDDMEKNELITIERYRIQNSFDNVENRSIQFSTRLHGAFDMPSDEEFPVATSDLDEIRSKVRVLYTKSPSSIKDEFTERNEFFDYYVSLISTDTTIECTTHFRPCVRFVPVEGIKECRAAIERVEQRVRTTIPIALNFEQPTSLMDHAWYLCLIALVMINAASMSEKYSFEIDPLANMIAAGIVAVLTAQALKPSLFGGLKKTERRVSPDESE